MTKQEIKQAEDRMRRLGVRPFKIKVLTYVNDEDPIYTIHATSALDARCLATTLYLCLAPLQKSWGHEHIDYALAYTEVVE